MRCTVCHAESSAESTRCGACGSAFASTCPKCQSPNPPIARYCSFCGEQLVRSSAPAERKIVTVLFADIVDSTDKIGGLDPESALSYLAPALTTMGTAIRQSRGLVMRTMGDGIMALFGAPDAQENHALLAAKAAIAMQQSSARSNFALRIGIHSGEVVAGLTEELTGEQSVYGAAIHLASRLEQLAEPGGIYMTEETFRLLHPYCDAASLGQRMVRGFSHPVGVYRLLGLRPASTSQQFRDVTLTSYRGRERELMRLSGALLEAKAGKGRTIGVSAPPGLGKSRLCFEFAERCRAEFVPVIEARASPYGYSGPLQPLLEFLRAYFRILPEDEPGKARERIAAQIETLGPSMEDDVPVLADFLGVGEEPSTRSKIDPRARQARLVRAISNLVRRDRYTPSVIIVEDIHWLDEGSGEFISALVDAVAGTCNLLVLSYRPQHAKPWMEHPAFEEIQLFELDRGEITALVAECAGSHPSIGAACERIVERSNGNPFFAEELVRSLVSQGVLRGDHGRYAATNVDHMETLPTTVQSVIGARVAHLHEAEKTILQIGATVGRECPFAVLEDVSGLPRARLVEILKRLCDLEFMRSDEQGSFGFRHPLIQEVAYAMQLKKRRSEVHLAVARALERFHQKRIGEYSDLISHHFESAGDVESAAQYAARAALWIGTTHSGHALKSWRRVRELLERQPRSEATDTLRMMSCGNIMNFGWREGMDVDEAEPFAHEALALARENGNALAETLLLAAYGRIVAATGSADTYVSHLQQAGALTSEGNRGQNALRQAILCQALMFAGKLREALAAGESALKDVAHVDAFQQQMLGFDVGRWVECLSARILVKMGQFSMATAAIEKLVATAAEHRDPAIQFIPHLASVELAWLTNNAELGDRHSRRIGEIARNGEIPYLAIYAGGCEALAVSLAGDQARAVRLLESTLALGRETRAGLEHEPDLVASLAEVHLRNGDREAAMAAARSAIAIARERRSRLAECRATISLAAASLSGEVDGHHTEVGSLLHYARALIEETGAVAYERSLEIAGSSRPAARLGREG